jgi:CRISPR-associated protein Cas1
MPVINQIITKRPVQNNPLLPARMLNEFVYCPRLFYYEFVENVFIHNADTREGAAQHKRVDAGKGKLPPAKKKANAEADNSNTSDEPPETIHARSVSLYSEKLHVNAKLDLVESTPDSENGTLLYQPVEYKKGRPHEGGEGLELWPADKIQLGVQILLLRENGYPCESGIVYYRETRQRVVLAMDDELEQWILERISAARSCAAGPIPAPLDNSPKCPRCSLVGFCLPDETRLLSEFSKPHSLPEAVQLDLAIDLPDSLDRISVGPFENIPEVRLPRLKAGGDVRRLIAPAEDTRALYLHTPGLFVGKKDATLQAKEKGGKVVADFRLNDLHHLALFGPVQISTGAIQALCEADIPITYFSMGGWFYGMTRGHSLKNVFTRIEQFRHAADPELAIFHARLFVYGKIRNQRTLLMRNHIDAPKEALRQLKWAASSALTASSLPSLLGVEGAAANAYFAHFAGMIKSREESPDKQSQDDGQQLQFPFDFSGRNRRPPRDPVNALLSLAYSLLSRDCTLAAYSAGFDPYVGFYHQPRFGRAALALDLMEEFRPLVADSVVLTLINNGMLRESDFVRAGDAVSLSAGGRKAFFMAYEKRINSAVKHPVFGYQVSYRRALELQFRLLARVLTGEIEQYIPFMTR